MMNNPIQQKCLNNDKRKLGKITSSRYLQYRDFLGMFMKSIL